MFREKPWIDPSQSNPHFSACIRVPRQKLYIANSGQVLDTKLREGSPGIRSRHLARAAPGAFSGRPKGRGEMYEQLQ